MSMNPLPPQDYTKETLTKAFSWLSTQSDSIKELASTPDILVSLYLKAKLNGEASLERPSIQNFKAELKNLAGMIGEFESPQSDVRPPVVKPAAHKTETHTAPQDSGQELDYRSLSMIREIKNELNLSSDTEALRLLISIGFKKLKSI